MTISTYLCRPTSPQQSGFTLIELLVAIALMAIVSAMAYRGLDQVVAAEKRLTDEYRQWRALNVALDAVAEELALMVARPVRVGTTIEPALVWRPQVSEDSRFDAQIKFSRLAHLDSDHLVPSRGLRVAYRFVHGRLERLEWAHLDLPQQQSPSSSVMLDGLAGVRWRFLDTEGRWHDAPPSSGQEDIPRAVEVGFVLTGDISVSRTVVTQSFWRL